MDLGIGLLMEEPGALTAPIGFLEEMRSHAASAINAARGSLELRETAGRAYEIATIAHPFTGIRITPKGMDLLEDYVAQVREEIGYEIPLAIDHFGHVCVEDCIRFAKRMEVYNIAWMEDPVPWQYTNQYVRLANSTSIPIATGEDIYLKEGFEPLIRSGGVSVVHPDVLTAGGILETKKIGEFAYENGVAVAVHMAESPIGCMAAIHAAAAMPQLLAVEFHSADVPWWNELVKGLPNPIVQNGFIEVPTGPGLGIEALNEKLIGQHLHKAVPGQWEPTEAWNMEWSNDRLWS